MARSIMYHNFWDLPRLQQNPKTLLAAKPPKLSQMCMLCAIFEDRDRQRQRQRDRQRQRQRQTATEAETATVTEAYRVKPTESSGGSQHCASECAPVAPLCTRFQIVLPSLQQTQPCRIQRGATTLRVRMCTCGASCKEVNLFP